MKLPKYIKTNYWYINRLPITIILLILISIYAIGLLLLNLIDLF